jgi:hypothetical protein
LPPAAVVPLEPELPDEPPAPLPPELELPDDPELAFPDEPAVPLPPLDDAPEPLAAPVPEPGEPGVLPAAYGDVSVILPTQPAASAVRISAEPAWIRPSRSAREPIACNEPRPRRDGSADRRFEWASNAVF